MAMEELLVSIQQSVLAVSNRLQSVEDAVRNFQIGTDAAVMAQAPYSLTNTPPSAVTTDLQPVMSGIAELSAKIDALMNILVGPDGPGEELGLTVPETPVDPAEE